MMDSIIKFNANSAINPGLYSNKHPIKAKADQLMGCDIILAKVTSIRLHLLK